MGRLPAEIAVSPAVAVAVRVSQKISELEDRKATCWEMARVFLDNKDAHGIHDMGVEVQALDRAIIELRAVLT